MSKKDLESLQRENEMLKLKIEKLENQELQSIGGYKWAKTLSQEEIDYIIQLKIVEEMIDYNLMSGDSPIKTIEKVIDFVNKEVDIEDMPEELEELLSLGLITKSVLTMSIAYFIIFLLRMNEDEDETDGVYIVE